MDRRPALRASLGRWIAFAAALAAGTSILAGEAPYDGHALVRVHPATPAEVAFLRALPGPLMSEGDEGGVVERVLAPEALARLERSGIAHEILDPNVQDDVDAERARLANRPAAAGADFYLDFRSLAELEARVAALVAAHPDLASVATIGQSLEGRPIRAVTVHGPGDPAGRPAVSLNGTQHAREWISPMTVIYAVERLLSDYGTDPRTTALLDAVTVHAVIVTNPDGYQYSWDVERFWRKNRRPNGDGTFGVDLNRNWSVGWGGAGSDGNPGGETYRGTAPFSEPESSAVRDFLLARPEIVAHVDVHSYGELVMWPYGYAQLAPPEPDKTTMIDLTYAMVAEIAAETGATYTPQATWQLYLAAGVCSDWAYDEAGALGWTIELRPATSGEGGFAPSPALIEPTGREIHRALLLLWESVTTGMLVRYPQGVPVLVDPDAPASFPARITPVRTAPLDAATAVALVRTDDGVRSAPLVPQGGHDYLVELPSIPCGDDWSLAIEIDRVAGDTLHAPLAPESEPGGSAAVLALAFADDGESDPGWTVENVALTDGAWDRGVPAGAGDRGDPLVDADGSGACWLTDNTPGNSDVDGGPTRLVSPPIDISALDDPELVFAAWFANDDGDGDRLDVHLSADDGATWTLAASLAQTAGWETVTLPIGAYVGTGGTLRLRFSATDNPNDSVTEAGVDAIVVGERTCPSTPGDVNGDGTVDFDDLLLVLGAWGPCPGCPEDLDGNGTVGFDDLLVVLGGWN